VADFFGVLGCLIKLRCQGEKALSVLPKLECDICSPDIHVFYDTSHAITAKNMDLLMLAAQHPQGAKLLSPGRVVIVRDGVSDISMDTARRSN
jgi:hypothetical protein